MEKNSSIDISNKDEEQHINKNIVTAAKGGSILFAGRLFGYASRLIFGIIVGRALGAEGLGLYTIGLTVATFFATVGRLGLPGGMIHFLPSTINNNDEKQSWEIIQIGLIIPFILATGLGLFLFFGSDFLAVNLFHNPEIAFVFRWVAFIIPLRTFAVMIMAIIRAFKLMQYQVYADSIVFNVTRLGLVILFLVNGWGIEGALAAYLIALVVSISLLLFYLNRIFSIRRPVRISGVKLRHLFSFSIPLLLSQVIERLRGSFELLMLGIVSTITTAGIYSAAVRIQLVGGMFLAVADTVARPIISDLFHRNELLQLNRIYQTLTRWSFSFILPYFFTLILFSDSILAIFGEEFREGKTVLIIVGLGTLINAATGICGAMVVMTGNPKLAFLNSFLAIVISIALNILLIPVWGLVGAAVSFAVALSLINMLRLFEVYRLYKFMPYNKEFFKPMVAGLFSVIVGYIFRLFLNPEENILFFLLDISSVWISYILMIIFLGVTNEDRMLLGKISNQLKRNFSKS